MHHRQWFISIILQKPWTWNGTVSSPTILWQIYDLHTTNLHHSNLIDFLLAISLQPAPRLREFYSAIIFFYSIAHFVLVTRSKWYRVPYKIQFIHIIELIKRSQKLHFYFLLTQFNNWELRASFLFEIW